ncbi:MAG: selenocysteine-specific translation elongation factor [Clostridiaceae bacterium]
MNNVVVGTAGHIDHGKTSLIKVLTGNDTDKLKEEKLRGISIDLGFTYLDLPSHKRVAIVDVPGHEKFIKNMLAGASSIDLVLMVIAADEGIMPQTREHFEIVRLLDVKKGLIVLTKTDLVDDEWLEMVKNDIKEEFKGSIFENSPICPVSSKTKKGINDLLIKMDEIVKKVNGKSAEGNFRLPIDRAFSISGFGTVVTGTVISGKTEITKDVLVYPKNTEAKIRGIEVHNKKVKSVEAGERCAINLSNVGVDEIKRGDVLSLKGVFQPSLRIACKLFYLESNIKPLKKMQRLRLYHGTSETLCRVNIFQKDELKKGEEAYVELLLEEPIVSEKYDRFVLRSYSPMITVAGGIILEPNEEKKKGDIDKYLQGLKIKENGTIQDILNLKINTLSKYYPDVNRLYSNLGLDLKTFNEDLNNLIEEKYVVKIEGYNNPVYISCDYFSRLIEKIDKVLDEFYKENPLKLGMDKEELKNKLFKELKQKYYDKILIILIEKSIIEINSNNICKYNRIIKLNENEKMIKESIIKYYKTSKFQFKEQKNNKNDILYTSVFNYLLDSGDIIKIGDDIFIHKEVYEIGKNQIVDFIKQNNLITPAQCRDLLNTNRRIAVAIMEYLDYTKITKRGIEGRSIY